MFVYICTNSAALILSRNKDNNLYAMANINEIMIFSELKSNLAAGYLHNEQSGQARQNNGDCP